MTTSPREQLAAFCRAAGPLVDLVEQHSTRWSKSVAAFEPGWTLGAAVRRALAGDLAASISTTWLGETAAAGDAALVRAGWVVNNLVSAREAADSLASGIGSPSLLLGWFEAGFGAARQHLVLAVAATGIPEREAEAMVLAALRDAGALG